MKTVSRIVRSAFRGRLSFPEWGLLNPNPGKWIVVLAVLLVPMFALRGQGSFQNLDFEAARIIFEDTGFVGDVATTNALPGWSAFADTNQLSIVQFGVSGAYFPVMLYAKTNGGSINGEFSVLLTWRGEGRLRGSISQTAVIPADARSLLFKAAPLFSYFPPAQPTLSLGGQNLSYTAVSIGANYTLYGADISPFAGQTETLSFTAGLNDEFLLDDIQFSSQPIPEPSAMSLILGAVGLFACFRPRAGPRFKKFARP